MSSHKIILIAAHDPNLTIGVNGKIPWHYSEDLKFFKKTTFGFPIVMGRKTFESIGKPLPNRTSIIVTRNKEYQAPENCYIVHSLEEGIEKARDLGDLECFINGGAQIYTEAMPKVNRAYITTVDCSIEKADAFFPNIDFTSWNEVSGFSHPKDERNE